MATLTPVELWPPTEMQPFPVRTLYTNSSGGPVTLRTVWTVTPGAITNSVCAMALYRAVFGSMTAAKIAGFFFTRQGRSFATNVTIVVENGESLSELDGCVSGQPRYSSGSGYSRS